MKSKKIVKKIFLITTIMYIMTLIMTIILNGEESLSSLKNGPVLMILFYGELFLILINNVINRTDKNITSLELKRILDIELIIKSIIFIIYTIILPNINWKFNSLIIYTGLIIAFFVNISFLTYSLRNINNLKINVKKQVNSRMINTNYSLSGIIIYVIAIAISSETTYLLIIKVCLFGLSIYILNNNLKKYYSVTKFINNINLALIIGSVINISIYIYLYFLITEIDKILFSNIRDIAFIVTSLFIVPYLKETQLGNG